MNELENPWFTLTIHHTQILLQKLGCTDLQYRLESTYDHTNPLNQKESKMWKNHCISLCPLPFDLVCTPIDRKFYEEFKSVSTSGAT